ncbi:MAG: helix-turn-helix domain-containing protein [Alphaproteobacteria bacterium]|nr:helix-turn-helix domain-containing protein [Alphaproteobacteria bacterium]
MAIKAHLDPSKSGDPQRAAPRRELRLETSGFVPGAGEANVTIHNISATGLLLETGLDLTQGERLTLDLPEAGAVMAVVVWRSERLFGCTFEQPLGPAALAAAQLQGFAPESAATQSRSAGLAIGHGDALGPRLNRLRREAGLTLSDVAAVLGVSKPTVWAWEKGKARPLPERLDAIAATLGVPPETLAETPASPGNASAVIEDCRTRIAEVCRTTVRSVRIMIDL